MNQRGITRIVAVLTAAAVLFGLEQGLGLKLYVAIPGGVLTYIVMLVAVGLMLGTGTDTPAK
jgi:membrane associated rhomboid family serine protease